MSPKSNQLWQQQWQQFTPNWTPISKPLRLKNSSQVENYHNKNGTLHNLLLKAAKWEIGGKSEQNRRFSVLKTTKSTWFMWNYQHSLNNLLVYEIMKCYNLVNWVLMIWIN